MWYTLLPHSHFDFTSHFSLFKPLIVSLTNYHFFFLALYHFVCQRQHKHLINLFISLFLSHSKVESERDMSSDQFQKNSMYIETPEAYIDGGKNFDEDGRPKRTGMYQIHTYIVS
jgi:hypothetical protein